MEEIDEFSDEYGKGRPLAQLAVNCRHEASSDTSGEQEPVKKVAKAEGKEKGGTSTEKKTLR